MTARAATTAHTSTGDVLTVQMTFLIWCVLCMKEVIKRGGRVTRSKMFSGEEKLGRERG
jgi:hypothetical protein